MSAPNSVWVLLAIAALALATIAGLAWPLLRPPRAQGAPVDTHPGDAHRQILREQWRQLDADHAAGNLSAAELQQARQEVEQRVLSTADAGAVPLDLRPAPGAALAVMLIVPACALLLWALRGQTPPATGTPLVASPAAVAPDPLVDRLTRRLGDEPVDADGWAMLGRSLAAMQRFDEAARAFARAGELAPPDADLLADHADVLAMAQGRSALGEPERLIERALALTPDHPKALALAGSLAHERGDLTEAARRWDQAARAAPPDSAFAAAMRERTRSLQDTPAPQRLLPPSVVRRPIPPATEGPP